MPLQQLIEYFNDRLEWQHQSQSRAFFLERGEAHGCYGTMRIGSRLLPVCEVAGSGEEVGYYARMKMAVNAERPEQSEADFKPELEVVDSVIDFDRLSRTVHMLNYLPHAHLGRLLFLDVDPRHILGVKQDHGAYFEEIIVKCGLETANVVICVHIEQAYARLFFPLLAGLENYQRRGYRLLLRFGDNVDETVAAGFLQRVAPDFIAAPALLLDRSRSGSGLARLKSLAALARGVNCRSVLLDVDDADAARHAVESGFDLRQGVFNGKPYVAPQRGLAGMG